MSDPQRFRDPFMGWSRSLDQGIESGVRGLWEGRPITLFPRTAEELRQGWADTRRAWRAGEPIEALGSLWGTGIRGTVSPLIDAGSFPAQVLGDLGSGFFGIGGQEPPPPEEPIPFDPWVPGMEPEMPWDRSQAGVPFGGGMDVAGLLGPRRTQIASMPSAPVPRLQLPEIPQQAERSTTST